MEAAVMDLIQPNLHPIVVHYAVAFLTVGPALLVFAAWTSGRFGFSAFVERAGDLMLGLGLLAATSAVAAGFYAYFTVAHDGASHQAMTDHRNWAVATTALFLVAACWRFMHRKQRPSLPLSLLLVAAVSVLSVTAWKGGHLVYGYGLGVASMPQVTGQGHGHSDHDHSSSDADAKADQHGSHGLPEANQIHSLAAEPNGPESAEESSSESGHDHSGHDHHVEEAP